MYCLLGYNLPFPNQSNFMSYEVSGTLALVSKFLMSHLQQAFNATTRTKKINIDQIVTIYNSLSRSMNAEAYPVKANLVALEWASKHKIIALSFFLCTLGN